ncbi:hypothetical protein pb186bvf_006787 [Paramecium bursaria]
MGSPAPLWVRRLHVCLSAFGFSCLYSLNIVKLQHQQKEWPYYLQLIILNVNAIMLAWSFFALLIIDPGKPRQSDEFVGLPQVRKWFCYDCKTVKPERCHHCSICKRCILQMDHHCPWINTCIGFNNRKQFILLVFYATIHTLITGIYNLQYAMNLTKSIQNFIYQIIYVFDVIIFLLLVIFLKYHIELLCKNMTTIEDIIRQQSETSVNIYDLSIRENVNQIFGTELWLYLLPIKTNIGDGHEFAKKQDEKRAPPLISTQQVETYEHPIISNIVIQCINYFMIFQIVVFLFLLFIIVILLARQSFNNKRIRRKQQEIQIYQETKTSIAFLHPYCNSGAGGEKVLMSILKQLQEQQYQIAVYSCELASDEEIRSKTQHRFNIQLKSDIQFIRVYEDYLLRPAKRFTMFFQILGQMVYSYKCLKKYQPDILFDTIGLPFSYIIFKLLLPNVKIYAYVHYPFISTDMIEQVEQKQVRYNNQENISKSTTQTKLKLYYYQILFAFYQFQGRFVDNVYVNSSWTYNHIIQTWKSSNILKLYPPCSVEQLMKRKIQSDKKFTIVSLAQFRPEKLHKQQLEIIQCLAEKLPKEVSDHVHLKMMGSVRGQDDELLFAELQDIVREKKLENHVTLYKNLPYDQIIQHILSSLIGLHTMEYEHFGISLVEMLAGGLIVVAHDSAGPKEDILRDRVGFLCEEVEDYVLSIVQILQMNDFEIQQMQTQGRKRAQQFSEESFARQFKL